MGLKRIWKRIDSFFAALSETPAVEKQKDTLAHANAIMMTRAAPQLNVDLKTEDLTVKFESPDDILDQSK